MNEENIPDNVMSIVPYPVGSENIPQPVTSLSDVPACKRYGIEARYPLRLMKDESVPNAIKQSTLCMFYGAMVSEKYCRTRYTMGRFCHATCTCLYDIFLRSNNEGEPNSALIRGVARFVVEDYYDKYREERLCTFAQIIKNAELEDESDETDPRKRMYELPFKAPKKSTTTIPQYYICAGSLTFLFGIGPHLWRLCCEAAAAAEIIVPRHGNFQNDDHARALDRTTKAILFHFFKRAEEEAEVLPNGKLRAKYCQRELYLRYIREVGYDADKTKTCYYIIKKREDWPEGAPRHYPCSKSAFITRWRRHFPNLLPAETIWTKLSLRKDCYDDDEEENESYSGDESEVPAADSDSSDSGDESEILIG